MSLSELRTGFLSVQIARRLSRLGLFRQKHPGALGSAISEFFSDESRKERGIDEEARRMVDAARAEISSQGADANELFRKIRKKLAEQKGIIL